MIKQLNMRFKILVLFLILGLSPSWLISQEQITLEDIWQNYKFYTKSVPGFNFMNDGKHYTRLKDNSIEKYDLTSGENVLTIVKGDDLKDQAGFDGKIASYAFSKDERMIMIESQKEKIYRRSSKAYFFVYNTTDKTLQNIHEDKVMYATISPNGKMVAYVYKNDLYTYNIQTSETIQVTNDGKTNEIINGSADWVYEEEFSIAKCFFWSPNGDKIAFMRFDEKEVPEFTMTRFNGDLYPEYETFKYPKVGMKNAEVSAHIYDTNSKVLENLDMGDMDDKYIPRIKWTLNNDQLIVFKMNRHQNHLQLHLFDTNRKSSSILLEERNKYYIDIHDDLTFLSNDGGFIWTSEQNGYNQIFLYGPDGKLKHNLTKGNYDVRSYYGLDEKRGLIYYSSAEVSPLESHIYSVDLSGRNKKKISKKEGTNSAQFSSTFDYYVLNHSNTTTPPNYTVFNHKDEKIRVIEENKKLLNHLEDYGLNPVEFFTFKTSEDVELNGYMIKPPNFNENRNYPVFMTQYSGPGSQSVLNRWGGNNYFWYQMLAQQGYIVACVDPRGTGARGEEFKKMTYLQLGKYETMDQIEAAKYLGALKYVDQNRIGIFGWSYGGYMSSLCLAKGADVFKAAIAVAPVTNWKWYDTIYTERYMRTYAENKEGYDDNSPINFVDKIKGNYLLVHGSTDDNVHWQHSAEMSAALIKNNIQYDTYLYPNRNHGIYGDNARIHLFTKMTNFLNEKLYHNDNIEVKP